MRVLIACEESQTVCKAFRSKGHEAFSCDIQDCSGGHPEWHIKGDVLKVLNPKFSETDLSFGVHFITMDGMSHFVRGKWDLLIAHPPCTYLSKAGARYMFPSAGHVNIERFAKAYLAKLFFMQLLNAQCDKICIENPTPLKIVGLPKESQVIQPYQFGEPYSKRTLLWLKGLPNLVYTNVLNDFTPYCPSNTSGLSRGRGGSLGAAHTSKVRSKTFIGIADAMADQWG